jgi:hippurate hydrolase
MVSPTDSGVVSVCEFVSGSSFNIIPGTARLTGTVRSLSTETRARIRRSMADIVAGVAAMFGAEITLDYQAGHPAVVNDSKLYELCKAAGQAVVGGARFVDLAEPTMGGEDFSCYLKHKPGCFLLLGNDREQGLNAMLHNASYDFNDEAAPVGVRYWLSLAEIMLPSALRDASPPVR